MKKNYRILDGYAWITAAVLLAIIIVSALCGCAGKKVITEQVYVHDTLVVSHTDTVRVEVVRTRTDTLRELEVREVTLMRDTAGRTDTVRVEVARDHYRYIYRGDSAAVFRTAVDSILKVLDERHAKTTVKKPSYSWQGYLIFLVVVMGCCIYCLVTGCKNRDS